MSSAEANNRHALLLLIRHGASNDDAIVWAEHDALDEIDGRSVGGVGLNGVQSFGSGVNWEIVELDKSASRNKLDFDDCAYAKCTTRASETTKEVRVLDGRGGDDVAVSKDDLERSDRLFKVTIAE